MDTKSGYTSLIWDSVPIAIHECVYEHKMQDYHIFNALNWLRIALSSQEHIFQKMDILPDEVLPT